MEAHTPTRADGDLDEETCLQQFEDYEEVMSTIRAVTKGGLAEKKLECLLQKFKETLDKYLEQRYLLDTHLAEIVRALVDPVKSPLCTVEMLDTCMSFLLVVTKVRGYKVVVNHLPHELSDLEPVLKLIEKAPPGKGYITPAMHMLLLWLGVLSMVPFQLSRLDCGDTDRKPVAERILNIIKTNVAACGKAHSPACFLAAHFITRPDMKDLYFDDFMQWLREHVTVTAKEEGPVWSLGLTEERKINVLSTLAMIFSLAKRDVVVKHAQSIMDVLTEKELFTSTNVVVRQLTMKLSQRIALSFLPKNLAPWRHLRSVKKLSQSLGESGALSEAAFPDALENDTIDVPEIVEEVIDKLLEGLGADFYEARWSAAKGIARIASRLPKDLASEIVSSVFVSLENRDSETLLHGCCFALAELGRRGTLLPEQLPKVVATVVPCLVFEAQLGRVCIGSNVRDAACYVCWTLSRSYDPCHLAPFVGAIAGTLVSVALFDREVMCRRAAAAAFQECVGRLGTFPHGIETVTLINYFSLSMVQHCYLSLSLQVAKFREYTQVLLLHLVEKKSGHSDPSIRLLCSQALFKLTPFDPGFVRETCMPKLLAALGSRDLDAMLGALRCVGEVVHSLAELGQRSGQTVDEALGEIAVKVLRELPSKYEEAKLLSSLGADQIKESLCFLIHKLANIHFPIHESWSVFEQWLSVINHCLYRDDSSLRTSACAALASLIEEYCVEKSDVCNKIVMGHLEGLNSSTEGVRCNFIYALGSLPGFLHRRYLGDILDRLTAKAASEGAEYADSKREAVLALARVCASCEEGDLAQLRVEALLEILVRGMEDYTPCPRRGDAGAYVRRACIAAFKELICHLTRIAPHVIPEARVSSMMCAIAKQAVEPVDGIRYVALSTFIQLLYNVPEIPFIPHHEQARSILPENLERTVGFVHAKETFPYCRQLLTLDTYREALIKGFLVCVGATGAIIIEPAKEALLSYLSTIHEDHALRERVLQFLVGLFNDIPFLKQAHFKYLQALEHLTISGGFREMPPTFILELQQTAWIKTRKAKAVPKLRALAGMLSSLLQFEGKVKQEVLNKLLKLLRNPWTKVRMFTAFQLCESLLLYTVIEDERELEEACTLLSETDWNGADIEAPIQRLRVLFNLKSVAESV